MSSGFRPGLTQKSLYNHIKWLEVGNLGLSKNKAADQLLCHCAPDLCLCFRICKKQVLSCHSCYHCSLNNNLSSISKGPLKPLISSMCLYIIKLPYQGYFGLTELEECSKIC